MFHKSNPVLFADGDFRFSFMWTDDAFIFVVCLNNLNVLQHTIMYKGLLFKATQLLYTES